MITNIPIDEELVEEARRAGRHGSREEAIRRALEEYVNHHRRQRIINLFGTVEYEDEYDYKSARRKDQP